MYCQKSDVLVVYKNIKIDLLYYVVNKLVPYLAQILHYLYFTARSHNLVALWVQGNQS